MASSETAKFVESQNRKVLGIEMEAYGVFCAAKEVSKPRPEVFVLKSIVDFANAEKVDAYHGYAAFTSARVLRIFVERLFSVIEGN